MMLWEPAGHEHSKGNFAEPMTRHGHLVGPWEIPAGLSAALPQVRYLLTE